MSPTPETPVSLLQRLQADKHESTWQQAWNDWYALYHPYLHRCLEPFRLTTANADEVIGEVLYTVVTKLNDFDRQPRQGAFRTWLRTILVNRVRRQWAKVARDRIDPDCRAALDALADPEGELSRRWDQEHDLYVMRKLLEIIRPRFTSQTWTAFHAVVLEEREPEAVAAELGMSVNAVYISRSRVLSCLRDTAAGLTD